MISKYLPLIYFFKPKQTSLSFASYNAKNKAFPGIVALELTAYTNVPFGSRYILRTYDD